MKQLFVRVTLSAVLDWDPDEPPRFESARDAAYWLICWDRLKGVEDVDLGVADWEFEDVEAEWEPPEGAP